MMSNAPRMPKPIHSSPRAVLILNNTALPLLQTQVTQTDFTKAATFTATTIYSPQDVQSHKWLTADADSPSEIFKTDKITTEIWIGYPANPNNLMLTDNMNRVIYGQVDTVQFKGDATQGELLVVSGRNMVGPMIDEQTTYLKYMNMTGSQLANAMADKYGLGKQITPTNTLIGTYFMQDSVNLASNVSEWDLLLDAASYDQFIVHVYDDILYYGPTSFITGMFGAQNLEYTWGYDIMSYDLTRSPSGVQDITVEVDSYNVAYKTQVKGIAKSHAPSVSAANPGSYTEKLIWPGLTQAQAQAKADQLLAQLSQKQIQGNIVINGASYIQVYNKLGLNGLGKGLDGSYYVTKVDHRYTMPQDGQEASDGTSTDGYVCTVYLSSQLLLTQTQVSNPLGIGVPITGQQLPVTDETQVSSSGKIYPHAGWNGMSQSTQQAVRTWLASAIQATGVDVNAWMPGMMWLVEAESGGDPTSKSKTPVHYWGKNDPRVTYAEGLCQMMPPTFAAYALPGHNNIDNPVDNAIASIRYIERNYKTVDNIPNIGTSQYGGY